MLKAGASSYIPKDCTFEELVQAIRLVLSNKVYLSPKVTEIVINDYVQRPGSGQTAYSLLTAREREVLQIVAEGKSTKKIAELLHVTVKTVETHIQKIKNKLGTSRIAELTKYAIRKGLTTLED